MKEEYFAYDRVVVPEYIRKMTSEERKAEIARIEEEIKRERLKKQNKQIKHSNILKSTLKNQGEVYENNIHPGN